MDKYKFLLTEGFDAFQCAVMRIEDFFRIIWRQCCDERSQQESRSETLSSVVRISTYEKVVMEFSEEVEKELQLWNKGKS